MSYVLQDSATMLRRNLKHQLRYPSLTLLVVAMPIVFLLLFVYVFGNSLGNGIGGADGGRAEYIRYVVPGILLMTVAAVSQGTAIHVAMDMTEGIVARFKTMSIGRASVLTGHVVGAVLQTMVAMVIVLAVALAIGFRSSANPVEWLAAFGLLALMGFALTWLSVALGMFAKNVESASNLPMPLTFLPFLGSGFVPTDSLPVGLRWFAEYQPFTPTIEAIRGLLLGGEVGTNALVGAAWCVGLSVVGYLWARKLYDRDPAAR